MVQISLDQPPASGNPYGSTVLADEFRHHHFKIHDAAPKKDVTFDEFCERVQVHGLLDWYKARSICAKTFWLLLMIFFLGVLIFGIVRSVQEYYINPIITTVSIAANTSLRFPEILLCPTNYVNYFAKDENYEYVQDYLRPKFTADLMDEGSVWEKLLAAGVISPGPEFDTPVVNVRNFKQLLQGSTFKISEFIPKCKFGGVMFDCAEVVQPFLHKDHEFCYKVDIRKLQKFPGIGLKLLLDINHEVFETEDPPAFQGVHVLIDDQIDPIAMTESVVGHGSYVKINMDLQYEELISVPESKTPQICHENEIGVYEVLRGPYSYGMCKADCIYKYVFDRCHCVPLIDKDFVKEEFHEQKFCNQTDVQNCMANIYEYYGKEVDHCSAKCQRACINWKIRSRQSQMQLGSLGAIEHFETLKLQGKLPNGGGDAWDQSDIPPPQTTDPDQDRYDGPRFGQPLEEDFPKDRRARQSNDNFEQIQGDEINFTLHVDPAETSKLRDPRYWQKSLILLDISFDDLMYTSIVQNRAKTVAELLSDIGGQTGLWLGCSIFSLIQLIVLVAGYFYTNSDK